jgi:fumarate hydratase class II
MTQTISKPTTLYELDYLLWTEETVAKLRARDFDQVDLENLIEEIEDLGRSQKRELKQRLKTLLEHLLKRIYVDMPQEFNGWERTIREQRQQIKLELMDSPSLKSVWGKSFDL